MVLADVLSARPWRIVRIVEGVGVSACLVVAVGVADLVEETFSLARSGD